MKALIHVVFWILIVVSALCKMDYTNVEINPALIIFNYLGSILFMELIMFYIGYGLAYQFLNGKRRLLAIGLVILVYTSFVIVLPIITRGIEPYFTPMQYWTAALAGLIDHFAWFAAGLVSRHYFDTNKLFVK